MVAILEGHRPSPCSAMDNSLLYGSIAAVGVAMLVMIVVVTLLVKRAVARSKTKASARQPAEGKKLMHNKSSWYSKDHIQSVPGQHPATRIEKSASPSRGYNSKDANDSPPPFTIPTYKPAVRHYHSPPNPYKQTTVPFTGVPGGNRRVVLGGSPASQDTPTSRYRSTDDRKESHNLNEEEGPNTLEENEETIENGGSMSRWHSEEHLPPIRSVFETGRSGSLLSIATTDSFESERGEGDSSPFKLLPNLELTMVWVSLSCSLSVTLSKLSNLPPKLKRSHIVVTMRLLRNPSTAQQSGGAGPVSSARSSPASPPSASQPFGGSPPKTPKMAALMHGSRMTLSNWSLSESSSPTSPEYKVKKSLDANFSQVFTFHDIGFFEARGSELLVQLKTRRRGPLSTKPFGEVCYKLVESNMEQDTPFVVTVAITPVKKSSLTASSPKHLPCQGSSSGGGVYSGSVQLTLLYQVTGHWSARVKMVVLRGQGLVSPRSGGEYRVEAVVRQEGSTIAVHKTNSVTTVASPVWNSPMLFDVHQAKVGDVTLEFSLVRVGRTRRSSPLGRILVGLDTTETGSQHWSEVMAKPEKEVTMWHLLTPS